LSNPQHIFTRVGGTRFIATMTCGAASVVLLVKGYLTGDQYVELGIWTVGAFVGANAAQNIASYFGNRRNNRTEHYGSGSDVDRQY
jgi:hypothetical protein